MSRTKSDEWSEVKDPNERRKIQNKLAQRRFRKSIFDRALYARIRSNIPQVTKSKSKEKSRIERQTTNAELAAHMYLRDLKTLRTITHCRAFHGEVYP